MVTTITHDYVDNISIEAVIFSFSTQGLKVLVEDNSISDKRKVFTLPVGKLGKEESLEVAATKLTLNASFVENKYLAQIGAFGGVNRNPIKRTISVAYFVIVDYERSMEQLGKHQTRMKWVDYLDLPDLEKDHNKIVEEAMAKLKGLIQNTSLAFHLLPSMFTLSELQMVFEVVLGIELDKRNFRKKIQKIEALEETDKKQKGVAHRAAKLYRFTSSDFADEVVGLEFV